MTESTKINIILIISLVIGITVGEFCAYLDLPIYIDIIIFVLVGLVVAQVSSIWFNQD